MNDIQKFLSKLSPHMRKQLEETLQHILDGLLIHYDVKKLSGYAHLYRVRKGNIRIIFSYKKGQRHILHISYRGNTYKK